MSFLIYNISIEAVDLKPKDSVYLQQGETFVVKVKLIDKIFQGKCFCANNGLECSLWSIRMTKIFYYPKNAFLDSSNLLLLKYITVPDKYKNSLDIQKEYTITLVPSVSDKYLSTQRIISDSINSGTKFIYFGQTMYYSSKFSCKKKRPWPIRLFYSRKNKYIILNDPFENALKNYENNL